MLFDVIPGNFFGPLAAPGRAVYWECICILYKVTSRQLSFGIERDTLVDELQYYFESSMAADVPEDGHGRNGKANAWERICYTLHSRRSFDHALSQRRYRRIDPFPRLPRSFKFCKLTGGGCGPPPGFADVM